jgi:hypothetical protein
MTLLLNIHSQGTIEPRVRREKPRIYFAGKIGKNDWRHALVAPDNLRGAGCDNDDVFNPNLTLDCGHYIYCGPFFISCDHGCSHGDNQHGIFDSCMGGDFMRPDMWPSRRNRIFDINLRRMRMADFVFAYIESADAYGTIIELGIAHGWRIPIALRLPTYPRDDMWMVAQTATRIYQGTAEQCWERFRIDFLVDAPPVA